MLAKGWLVRRGVEHDGLVMTSVGSGCVGVKYSLVTSLLRGCLDCGFMKCEEWDGGSVVRKMRMGMIRLVRCIFFFCTRFSYVVYGRFWLNCFHGYIFVYN